MDRSTARSLMESLKSFLGPFEEEHDVKITVGTGNFDSSTLNLKLEIAELSENGEALSRAANDFKTLAPSFGLLPDDLGKEFKTPQGVYKIVGLKPRSYRYPVIAESRGKRFKFSAENVKMHLGRNKTKRSKEEILNELRDVEAGLSPENLSCDGEASKTWVQRRYAELNRQKRQLISELGYTPAYPEIYARKENG